MLRLDPVRSDTGLVIDRHFRGAHAVRPYFSTVSVRSTLTTWPVILSAAVVY